ncbi:hypothetical protein C8J56DRAFT_1156596 [Mycena floridula]|nr:hypothetical protein C8J56DRAFT_1156596 [Mycena floridula]
MFMLLNRFGSNQDIDAPSRSPAGPVDPTKENRTLVVVCTLVVLLCLLCSIIWVVRRCTFAAPHDLEDDQTQNLRLISSPRTNDHPTLPPPAYHRGLSPIAWHRFHGPRGRSEFEDTDPVPPYPH